MIWLLLHHCQQGLALLVRKIGQMPDESNDMPDLLVLMRGPESGHPRHTDAVADHPEELPIGARSRSFGVQSGSGRVKTMRQLDGRNLGGAMTENTVGTIVFHP